MNDQERDTTPTLILYIQGGIIQDELSDQPVTLIVIDADTGGVDKAELSKAPDGSLAIISTYDLPGRHDLTAYKPYRTPGQGTCTHTPDWPTVTSLDGEEGVVDVNCSKCGLSGSFRIDNEDINW